MSRKLPEYLARVTIKDMIVGEKAYTVPWSLQVDQNGVCWLRGDYAFRHRKFGTSTMMITRTAEGFEVKVSAGTRFEQLCLPPGARSRIILLPVVKIH